MLHCSGEKPTNIALRGETLYDLKKALNPDYIEFAFFDNNITHFAHQALAQCTLSEHNARVHCRDSTAGEGSVRTLRVKLHKYCTSTAQVHK